MKICLCLQIKECSNVLWNSRCPTCHPLFTWAREPSSIVATMTGESPRMLNPNSSPFFLLSVTCLGTVHMCRAENIAMQPLDKRNNKIKSFKLFAEFMKMLWGKDAGAQLWHREFPVQLHIDSEGGERKANLWKLSVWFQPTWSRTYMLPPRRSSISPQ